ncbi:hypothetical protein BJ741DRAFT_585506 [Chytriomyces cf. hyalinus JEL632]|nr:hypothetical protein BJ741DRAFT_585506 [Chytriomyces cf. hyalinus JEL632]
MVFAHTLTRRLFAARPNSVTAAFRLTASSHELVPSLVHLRRFSRSANSNSQKPAAHAPSTDIFASVHSTIPQFDEIQIPDEPSTDNLSESAPTSVLSLTPSNVLPPFEVLDHMQKTNRIQISPKDAYFVLSMIQYTWNALLEDQTKSAERGLIDRILKICTIKDLTVLGTMAFEHSAPGKPLGFKILEMCKNEGNLDAEFKYAHILSQGFEGQKRNQTAAIEILQSLVAKKHPISTYVLAVRQIRMATSAAETANTTDAQTDKQLVNVPLLTKGLRNLHTSASELNFPQAQMQMGHLYLYGGLGVPKDAGKAYGFLEKAGNHGITEAMFLCGVCCEKGLGVEAADMAKAGEWWQKAANKGLAIAQHNLASLYFAASTSPTSPYQKSMPLAIEYFEMAATQGLPLSLINLAKLYKEGYMPLKGEPSSWAIAVDLKKAEQYAERVSELEGEWGELGKELLEQIKKEGSGN